MRPLNLSFGVCESLDFTIDQHHMRATLNQLFTSHNGRIVKHLIKRAPWEMTGLWLPEMWNKTNWKIKFYNPNHKNAIPLLYYGCVSSNLPARCPLPPSRDKAIMCRHPENINPNRFVAWKKTSTIAYTTCFPLPFSLTGSNAGTLRHVHRCPFAPICEENTAE